MTQTGKGKSAGHEAVSLAIDLWRRASRPLIGRVVFKGLVTIAVTKS